MMKKRNIIWVFVIVLLFVLTGLYLSRNRWAGYLLKKEVTRQSDGNINLSFSAIHLDIFKKRLTILNPALTYKNTYINASHSLKLEATKFKKLSVYDLYLWNFFVRGEYICKEFMVAQPTFQLASGDTTKTDVDFNPSAWLKVIQKHRLAVVPVKFKIKHAYIKLGKIRLGKLRKTGEFGGADYDVSIEDLGNINSGNSSGAIFYKNLKINIHNVYRKSKHGDFSLKIDDISYLSSLQEFIISGLHYNSIKKDKNQNLEIHIKWAKINGLLPDTATKTFHITSARWKGGSIIFPEGKLSQLFSGHQPDKHLEAIAKSFPYIKLDTLSINHVHISRLEHNIDTSLSIKNFNINILDAKISGKSFRDPLRFMSFSSLNTKMNGLYFMNPYNGDKIVSHEVIYESSNEHLSATDLSYIKLCPADRKPAWIILSKQISVDHFSGKKFHKNEAQSISVKLLSPDIRVWERQLCKLPHNKDFKKIIGKLTFNSLNLNKGRFEFYGKKNGTYTLSGLDLYAGNLKQNPDSGKNLFSYDTLYFKANHSELLNPGKALKMKTGVVQWLDKNLSLSNLLLTKKSKHRQRNISIPLVAFTHIKLNSLISEKKLAGKEADFYKPNVIILQQDSLQDNDTLPFRKKELTQFPFKISFSKVFVHQGHLNLTVIHSSDSVNLNTGINFAVNSFKLGTDKKHLSSSPSNWSVKLNKTSFRNQHISGSMDSAILSSRKKTLNIRNILISPKRGSSSVMHFTIKVPLTQVSSINYPKLFRSDSLVFGKIAFRNAKLHFSVPEKLQPSAFLSSQLPETTILFDSLEINHSNFTLERILKTSNLKITGNQLDVLYKPLLKSSPQDSILKRDFLKKWDISLKKLKLSDTINNIKIVADGIALQSRYNQLFIKSIAGNNLPGKGSLAGQGKDYADFKLQQMKFSGLQLKGPDFRKLHISKWTTPVVRLKVIQETNSTKQTHSHGLLASLFNKNNGPKLISGIHIDSTKFKTLNFSFLYDNQQKQVNISDVGLDIHGIEIDSTLMSPNPNYIFNDLRLDSHGKTIISGDSMYVFRTRDIRVNLPQKRISLDSITITPRFKREAFFEKEKKQTDRVTLYGKSIDFNNFDFSTLLKKKVFHVGDVSLNNFNVLFERDKHYPLSDSTQPMPLEMLRQIPYKFRADTIKINRGYVSYYEYQKKSVNPGIFFIDNFNVYFLNVTNDIAALNSSAVLKVHGSGQMMRAANLNFVLLMPYFSPDNQFWFSAQTSRVDLTQFNSLAQNVIGISIKSGYASADVQYVTGNSKFAKGNMLFQYKNLKLRLYNRKKAKTSKGLGSPFVNFMLNNLMIRSNNPKFLKPPRKGIVYFERDPRKSFINYLWKSSFSGITSTLGFNNKQQRHEKKTEKKTEKKEIKAEK